MSKREFPINKNGHLVIFKTRPGGVGGGSTGGKKYKDGYVYFIKIREHDIYKIGVSNNPSVRLRDIDSYLPFDFDILSLHYFEGMYDVEKEIADSIKDYKIKREWYQLSIEQAKKIMIDLHEREIANERTDRK